MDNNNSLEKVQQAKNEEDGNFLKQVPELTSLQNESNQQHVPFHSLPADNKKNSDDSPNQRLPKQISPSRSAQTPQEQQQHRRIFKIIVIGDSNVGKTCLTFRFCGGKFLQRSEATIGVDFREKTIQIDDEIIKLQIWDTGLI